MILSACGQSYGFGIGYAGMQSGRVVDIAAVTFSKAKIHFATELALQHNPDRAAPGVNDDPTQPDLSQPISSRRMWQDMLATLSSDLARRQDGLRAGLSRMLEIHTGQPLPENASIGAMIKDGGLSALPPKLAQGVAALHKATQSALSLLSVARVRGVLCR